MKKLNQEQLNSIGRIAKTGCKYLFYGLAAALTYSNVTKGASVSVRYSDGAGYGDAVRAIINSDMWDSYKEEAMEALIKDGNSDFYEAVIAIVESDMWDSYKVESIKKLCTKN